VPRSGQTAAGGEKAPKERGDAESATATPVLYDARDRGKLPPGVEREPKLAPEVEKLVHAVLSPADEAGDCQDEQEPALRVLASAAGSFTAPGAKQVAYIVARADCGASGAGAVEATHLIVVEGDKVVLHAPSGQQASGEPPPFRGSDIRAVVNVAGDGASELLVTSSDGSRESARLYALEGGEVEALDEFRDVYVNGCGAGARGQVTAQVIHYAAAEKGAAPRFSTESYQAPCPASGTPASSDFQPVKPAGAPAASPSASAEPSAKPS
jgi:hypothetical protein